MTNTGTSTRAGRDDVRVRQRAVGDPLHDGRVQADRAVDASGTRPGRASRARCSTSTETTTIRWRAEDIKGNVAYRQGDVRDQRPRAERPRRAARADGPPAVRPRLVSRRLVLALAVALAGAALVVAVALSAGGGDGDERAGRAPAAAPATPTCASAAALGGDLARACYTREYLARGARPRRPAPGGRRRSPTRVEGGPGAARRLPRDHAHGRAHVRARARA